MQWSPQQDAALVYVDLSIVAAHNRIDLVGQRFGLLVVQRFSGTVNRKARWVCQCDCGVVVIAIGSKLRRGHTTSCGCRQREASAENLKIGHDLNFRHGAVGTRTYKSWDGAKQRCENPHHHNFHLYGGAGVRMCARWRASFLAFLEDMGERPPGKTLDRWPDPYGNYEPGNCRWATPKEQANNRRQNPRDPAA